MSSSRGSQVDPSEDEINGKRNAPSDDEFDEDGYAVYRNDEKISRKSVHSRDSNASKHVNYYMKEIRKILDYNIRTIPFSMLKLY